MDAFEAWAAAADSDGMWVTPRPLTDTDVAALAAVARSHPLEFFLDDRQARRLLAALVDLLNDADAGSKVRLAALSVIADLARVKAERTLVLEAFQTLSERFEKLLDDKERAQASFGTSLGHYHSTVVVILARVCDYKLTTKDLLEFLNGRVKLGLAVCTALLKVRSYENQLVACVCQLLEGFTMPQTFMGEVKESDVMAEHSVDEFVRQVGVVRERVMSDTLVEALETGLEPRYCIRGKRHPVLSDASQHAAISSLCQFLHNVYLFAGRTVSFRQHLLVSSDFCPSVLRDYVVATATMIATGGRAVVTPLVKQGLSRALQTLALTSFRMPKERARLKRVNPTFAFREAASELNTAVSVLLPLLFWNVNADCCGGSPAEQERLPATSRSSAVIQALQACVLALTPKCRAVCRQNLAGEGSKLTWLPVSRDNESYRRILGLFGEPTAPTAASSGAGAGAGAGVAHGAPDRAASTPGVVDEVPATEATAAPSPARAPAAAAALASSAAAASSVTATSPSLAPSPAATAPTPSLVPTRTPRDSGVSSTLAAATVGTVAAVTGTPSVDSSARTAAVSTLASGTADLLLPRSFVTSNSKSAPASVAPSTKPATPTKGVSHALDCPVEFLCAINGHMMSQPVRSKRSPTSPVFEKATIELWISRAGSVCPITGDTLLASDLRPCKDLERRIVQWHIKQTLAKQMAPTFDGDDLYDF